jgi:hypothetical protein
MKKKLLFIVLSFLCNLGFAEKLEYKGFYLGQNLYVMNPLSKVGAGYSIYEVNVNGNISSDEINSSAFEIDLTQYDLKIGEPITIILFHKEDSYPRIVNPDVIKARSKFDIVKYNIDQQEVLHWTTTKEIGNLPFVIQQYRWKKWITLGEIKGKGNLEKNEYEYKVEIHTGKNIFRIFQTDHTEEKRYSTPMEYSSNKSPIIFGPEKIRNEMIFSNKTKYEIYDDKGSLILEGFGDTVNLKGLKRGVYYVNFDNRTESFNKR